MTVGNYIKHSLKYFLKLLLLVVLIYLLLFVSGTARISAQALLSELFTSRSGLLMLLALLLLSGFYPKFGFVSRKIGADIVRDREKIVNALHASGYSMTKEKESESMEFRASSAFKKIWTMWDDKITVTATDDGIVMDGIRKEVVQAQFRINTFLENTRDEE